MMRTIAFCGLLLAVLSKDASGLDVRWTNGTDNMAWQPRAPRPCTLLVTRSPEEAAAQHDLRLLWQGDGELYLHPIHGNEVYDGEELDSVVAVRVNTLSRRRCFVLGEYAGQVQDTFVAELRTGVSFTIGAFSLIAARAYDGPTLAAIPTATINGSPIKELRCEPINVEARVDADSVFYHVSGPGMDGVRRVRVLVGSSVNPWYASFQVTSARALVFALPRRLGTFVKHATLIDRTGAPTHFVTPTVRAPETPTARLLAVWDDSGWRRGDAAMLGAQREEARAALRECAMLTVGDAVGSGLRSPVTNELGEPIVLDPTDNYFIGTVPAGVPAVDVLNCVRALRSVRVADTLRSRYSVLAEPDDEFYPRQWTLHDVALPLCDGTVVPSPNASINAPQAWDYPHPGSPVQVAILDTGVGQDTNETSPAFTPGYDRVSFIPGDPEPYDNDLVQYHGTAVASIAAGTTNNAGEGLAGTAWGAVPIAVKIEGPLTTVAIWGQGIDWVSERPYIPILNMSIGSPALYPAEIALLTVVAKRAFVAGKFFVAAIGNNVDSVPKYPAAIRNYVVAVGATLWNNMIWTDYNVDGAGDPTRGSTFGSWIDFVAPGGRLVTAAINQRDFSTGCAGPRPYYLDLPCNWLSVPCVRSDPETMAFGGTSSSAPVVSGAAAWLKSMSPSLQGEDLYQVLARTATDMGVAGFDVRFGNGALPTLVWLKSLAGPGQAAPPQAPIAGPKRFPSKGKQVPWAGAARRTRRQTGRAQDALRAPHASFSPHEFTHTIPGRAGNGRINLGSAAAFVSSPNVVIHGLIGNGGDSPLSVADSAPTLIAFRNVSGLVDNQLYVAVRYHLRGTYVFAIPFVQNPERWVRAAATNGIGLTTVFDDLNDLKWGGIIPGGSPVAEMAVETYLYRIVGADNRWYPVHPDVARVAVTAVGPRALTGVALPESGFSFSVRQWPNPGRGMVWFEIRGMRDGGLAHMRIFDIAGRTVRAFVERPSVDGALRVAWDGKNIAGDSCSPGVYVCRADWAGETEVRRFVWTR